MREQKESQKQKRIVKRQENANTMLNKAVSSGNLKKEARAIENVKKLQTKYKDAGDAKRKVFKTNKDGVKERQVSKNGVVKKTVTRTKGGVEKEIERGNKRIDVRKYKEEDNFRQRKVKSDESEKYVTRKKGRLLKSVDTDKKQKVVRRGKDAPVKYKEIIKTYSNNEDFKWKKFKSKEKVKNNFDEEMTVGDVSKVKVTPFKKKIMDYDASTGVKNVDIKKTGIKRSQVSKEGLLTNMVKNSAFKNLPSSMVKDAAKPENNVLPANRMDKFMQGANKAFISAVTKSAEKQRKENQ